MICSKTWFSKQFISLYSSSLNFIMYILTILKCPLKTNINALYNQISMNIFFTIKGHSFPLRHGTHLGFNVLKMLKKILQHVYHKWKQNFKNPEALLSLLRPCSKHEKLDNFKLMNLIFDWISIIFKVSRKYLFRKWRKVDTFIHNISSTILKSLYRTIYKFCKIHRKAPVLESLFSIKLLVSG